ncbi:hypothetical protein GGD38_004131 [Chitinophagaceae bacterium OAS944]|nr:hypothetical protein [Chitinophagaceae bacterium OAS944]
MIRNGVGFSMDLIPRFATGRTDLRVHPDGNLYGTLGCIGLQGTATELRQFRNTMRGYLRVNGSINVTVNINGNPNNNGRGSRANTSGIRE